MPFYLSNLPPAYVGIGGQKLAQLIMPVLVSPVVPTTVQWPTRLFEKSKILELSS